jgi:hypothetical protein
MSTYNPQTGETYPPCRISTCSNPAARDSVLCAAHGLFWYLDEPVPKIRPGARHRPPVPPPPPPPPPRRRPPRLWCVRCGRSWQPLSTRLPKECARCHSSLWWQFPGLLRCWRCGQDWMPRFPRLPRSCARCGSKHYRVPPPAPRRLELTLDDLPESWRT